MGKLRFFYLLAAPSMAKKKPTVSETNSKDLGRNSDEKIRIMLKIKSKTQSLRIMRESIPPVAKRIPMRLLCHDL